jgi:tellurite resistance-related uncharacterized protein
MIRSIVGYHLDDEGQWVAELSCLHNQHVRHQPPFLVREWVTTEEGRASHLGTEIDCPLCDRAELPDDVHTARTAGPFDADTIPAALGRNHRVAEHTWGLLRVLDGAADFWMATDPPVDVTLEAGASQPIPPTVEHRVTLRGTARVAVDFLVR